MFPLLGGLISGGLGLIGSMFSSDTAKDNTSANIAMQNQTNVMNAAEAQKNREFQQDQAGTQRMFQESMSNTAYARASADMQRAGLNPAMMFGSAGSASSPAGSSPSGSTASFGTARSENRSALQDLGKVADNAVSTAINVKTYEKMTEEIANLKAQEARTQAERHFTEQKTRTEDWETQKRGAEAESARFDVASHRVSAREKEAVEKLPAWLIDSLSQLGWGSGKTASTSDQISSWISSAVGAKRLAPRRSTSETSRQDNRGNWYDEFRENRSNW